MRILNVDFSDIHGAEELTIANALHATTLTERLEDVLIDHQQSPTGPLLDELETVVEDAAIEQAAGFVRILADRLGHTAAGAALRHVLSGDAAPPVRELARQAGCSHVAVLKHAKRIRQCIGEVTSQP